MQRLRRQAQKFLVVTVGFPHGEVWVVVDICGDICDLGLPKFDASSDLLNQLVGKLHNADIFPAGDELDIHFCEVFLLVIGVVVSQVFLQLLSLCLEGRRGDALGGVTEIRNGPLRTSFVVDFVLAPGLERQFLGRHYYLNQSN